MILKYTFVVGNCGFIRNLSKRLTKLMSTPWPLLEDKGTLQKQKENWK